MSETLALLKEGVDASKLLQKAGEVLKLNEKDGFIMPDNGYYDGAWLWDTGFIVMGESYLEPEKAANRLLNFVKKAQWKNGFIPHILYFNEKAISHSFGPEYWDIHRSPDAPANTFTSGITQPPVLGFAALKVYENLRKRDSEKAKDFLREIYPPLLSYHRYLYHKRDPEESGLVSIYHPWESGLDNLPAWEDVLVNIDVTKNQTNEVIKGRKDIKILTEKMIVEGLEYREAYARACEMRPTNSDYARYIYLLRFLRDRNYDDSQIYNEIPFNVKDTLFNSILYVSTESLLEIAVYFKKEEDIKELEKYLKKQKDGLEKLYDKESGLYFDFDLYNQKYIRRRTISAFAPLFAGVANYYQAKNLFKILVNEGVVAKNSLLLVPSTLRSDKKFSTCNYWQGPVWLPTTWLVIRGFEKTGFFKEADLLKESILDLIGEKGFFEYYNPETGEGLGMREFSWTAALAIDLFNS